MAAFVDWVKDLFDDRAPPPRTLQLRPHVPTVPPPRPSIFLRSTRSDTFHGVSDQLRRANERLGVAPGTRHTQFWPDRADWGGDLTEARRLRGAAVSTILNDISTQQPHLRQFTDRIRYDPESFALNDTARAHTGGWLDDPRNQPFTRLSDRAFSDTYNLNRTIRHEVWHQIQRSHPQVYQHSSSLREFDAHLRDLENRTQFGLGDREKFLSLTQAHSNLSAARQEPFWTTQLQQVQRDNFAQRYDAVRHDVCRELADTPFRTMPDYSRICGPLADPFQAQVDRMFRR